MGRLELVTPGGDARTHVPVRVVFLFVPQLQGTTWVFEDEALENGADFVVFGPRFAGGVGGVHLVDAVPEGGPVLWLVGFGDEDVGCELEAELDVADGGDVVDPGSLDVSSQEIVPICVGGTEEVFSVFDEDVPEGDGVIDKGVLVVE